MNLNNWYQAAALASLPKSKPEESEEESNDEEIDQSLVQTVELTDEQRQQEIKRLQQEQSSIDSTPADGAE